MNPVALRLLRVPLALGVVWAVLAATIPLLMTMYSAYVMRPGFACAQSVFRSAGPDQPSGGCRSLADLYGVPFPELFVDAAFRSLALLALRAKGVLDRPGTQDLSCPPRNLGF